MKVAEYIQKNKEAMPPELAEMLTQETSIWSNDACYGYMIIAMRNTLCLYLSTLELFLSIFHSKPHLAKSLGLILLIL